MSSLGSLQSFPEAVSSVRQGFLWKQSKAGFLTPARWRSSYYLLQGTQLLCAASPHHASSGKPAFASALTSVAAVDDGATQHATQMHGICLTLADGTSETLYCDSHLQRGRWVHSLASSLRQMVFVTDDYVVNWQELLGSGLFANVVTAREKASGERLALKILHGTAFRDHAPMIQREIAVWHVLGHHPHIVDLREVMVSKKRAYFVAELCNGGDLMETVAGMESYCERDVSGIVWQLLLAVQHMHGLRVAHLDIKPENIVVAVSKPGKAPHIKLIDFSLAAFFESPCDPGGTPEFVAPELLRDPDRYAEDGCGPEVDMWSIGIVIYFLLSGQTPFQAASSDKILELVRAGKWAFRGKRWESVSNDARDLVARLLQADPESRLSVRQALEHRWISGRDANATRVLLEPLSVFKEVAALTASSRKDKRANLMMGAAAAASSSPSAAAAAPAYVSYAPLAVMVDSSGPLPSTLAPMMSLPCHLDACALAVPGGSPPMRSSSSFLGQLDALSLVKAAAPQRRDSRSSILSPRAVARRLRISHSAADVMLPASSPQHSAHSSTSGQDEAPAQVPARRPLLRGRTHDALAFKSLHLGGSHSGAVEHVHHSGSVLPHGTAAGLRYAGGTMHSSGPQALVASGDYATWGQLSGGGGEDFGGFLSSPLAGRREVGGSGGTRGDRSVRDAWGQERAGHLGGRSGGTPEGWSGDGGVHGAALTKVAAAIVAGHVPDVSEWRAAGLSNEDLQKLCSTMPASQRPVSHQSLSQLQLHSIEEALPEEGHEQRASYGRSFVRQSRSFGDDRRREGDGGGTTSLSLKDRAVTIRELAAAIVAGQGPSASQLKAVGLGDEAALRHQAASSLVQPLAPAAGTGNQDDTVAALLQQAAKAPTGVPQPPAAAGAGCSTIVYATSQLAQPQPPSAFGAAASAGGGCGAVAAAAAAAATAPMAGSGGAAASHYSLHVLQEQMAALQQRLLERKRLQEAQ